MYYIVFQYVSFFKHYFHYNIILIILINLHRIDEPSRCLFYDMNNIFVVLTTNKSRLFTVVIWLHCIRHQQYRQTLRLRILQTQRWVQFINIHTTTILSIALKNIQDKTRWLFFIVLHFVKRFLWYQSFLNQYIYYCDLFCLEPASRICHLHRHVWVRYFDTTKFIVCCMSSILIHMSYFYFYNILSYRARSSKPQVVSRYSSIVSAFFNL